MVTSLIICTYQRPKPLLDLLQSVAKQDAYPNQILIIDGSIDDNTKEILLKNTFYKYLFAFIKQAVACYVDDECHFN